MTSHGFKVINRSPLNHKQTEYVSSTCSLQKQYCADAQGVCKLICKAFASPCGEKRHWCCICICVHILWLRDTESREAINTIISSCILIMQLHFILDWQSTLSHCNLFLINFRSQNGLCTWGWHKRVVLTWERCHHWGYRSQHVKWRRAGGSTVDILIMHGLRLEPTWDIGIYSCILISNNAYQPIHNLAGYALLDVLVPI